MLKYRSPVAGWIQPGVKARLYRRDVVEIVKVSTANLGYVYVRKDQGQAPNLVLGSELTPFRDEVNKET